MSPNPNERASPASPTGPASTCWPPCPDGEVQSIEVKGRAGRGAIEMEANEWKQACHLGERYWLYVVFDCATPAPRLVRICNPFDKLLASERAVSTYSISQTSLLKAAEPSAPLAQDARHRGTGPADARDITC